MNNIITDKKLDELLSGYFKKSAPYTFRIKDEKINKEFCFMKKSILIKAVSITACLAIILSVFMVSRSFADNNENSFVIIANAETASPDEISAKKFTQMDDINWSNFSLNRNRFFMAVCFNTRVKGENIDTVSYKMKKGVFEIYNRCGDIVNGEKINIKRADYYDIQPEYSLYKSYTVNYKKQPSFSVEAYNKSNTFPDLSPIAIPILVKAEDSPKAKKLLNELGDANDYLSKHNVYTGEKTVERNKTLAKLIKYALDDKLIDVTAKFKDDSVKTKTLKIDVDYKDDFLFNKAIFKIKLV